jgi:hypothetical protein
MKKRKKRERKRKRTEKNVRATSCIEVYLNNITHVSIYRETMSNEQVTLEHIWKEINPTRK